MTLLSIFQDFKMTSSSYLLGNVVSFFNGLCNLLSCRVGPGAPILAGFFLLTVLLECVKRPVFAFKDLMLPNRRTVPQCPNRLLFLDKIPPPLKLSIPHSVGTCLGLPQKFITLYTLFAS